MIATEVKKTYECPVCQMTYALRFVPKLAIDATRIANRADRLKKFTICARYMRIKKAVFKTTKAKDEYGDSATGTWYCPTHIGLSYYPLVIKSAVESKSPPIITGRLMHSRYLKMASMRYPWKCPICNQLMLYRESKGV